jgi:hypothetical protein
MLQNDQPKLIQGLILDPATSLTLQDESCAPAHANQERGIVIGYWCLRVWRFNGAQSLDAGASLLTFPTVRQPPKILYGPGSNFSGWLQPAA